METVVVNLYQDPYDVYIGREGKGESGYFGNPFLVTTAGREACIKRYRTYFYTRITEPEFRKRIESLKGKRLGCFCKPKACHGDVIVEYLEGTK